MNNRQSRKQIAEDTLRILEQGYFISSNGKRIDIAHLQERAEAETKVYKPEETNEILSKHNFTTLEMDTKISVVNQSTLDAVRTLVGEGHENVLCLNFASAKNPGGGFLGGSQAQEESIARSSGLYPCLLKASEYYNYNRSLKSGFYSDYMIYSPFVPIIKNEEGEIIEEPMYCGIITAPAVNNGVVKRREPERINEVETVMKRRIKKVLAIAHLHQHRCLVLGAWGCGVFQNNPIEMARYFKEILDGGFKNKFERIFFAVFSSNERFIKPFYHEFGGGNLL